MKLLGNFITIELMFIHVASVEYDIVLCRLLTMLNGIYGMIYCGLSP